MCTYFVLNKYYYIIILYGGSHASDILHVYITLYYYLFTIINVLLQAEEITHTSNITPPENSVRVFWVGGFLRFPEKGCMHIM